MKSFADVRLYGIVDLGYTDASRASFVAGQLVDGGAEVLQLRAKNAPVELVRDLALAIHPITSAAGVPLIINDHPALLRETPAEGTHVGQDDMSVEEAREAAGRPCIVGKSTHSPVQAASAESEGADYIGFGPIFATPTKPGRPAVGLGNIAAVYDAVTIPIFCIGGIKRDNLSEVLAAGAKRIVMVSGWLQAADITAAVREIRGIVRSV